ncbi:MAG: DUF4384 domain-containing protein [Bryobacteraceae bacterium]
MRTVCLVLISIGVLSVECAAQSDDPTAGAPSSTLNARDMFWSSASATGQSKPAKPAAATPGAPDAGAHSSSKGPLGLRYTILKALPGGGQVEVLPDTVFKAHDAIRLSIESNKPGYLYIVLQGSSGAWTPLYREAGQQHQIQPGKEYIIPSPPASFEFDEHAGQERLFVLLSEKPMQDLESLVMEAQSKPTEKTPSSQDNSIDDVISQIKLVDRDLVFTKASKDAPAAGAKKQDSAMYVVNKSADGSRVVVDLVLKHQ